MKTYDTPDIYLASYLCYMGYEVKSLEKRGYKAVFRFVLKEDNELSNNCKLLIDYYNGRASVEPLKFIEYMRKLKSMARNV